VISELKVFAHYREGGAGMSLSKRIADLSSARVKAARVKAKNARFWRSNNDAASDVECYLWWMTSDEYMYGVMSMDVLDEVFGGVSKTATPTAGTDPGLAAVAPVVTLLLTDTRKVEGKVRQTATMMVVYEDGFCKLGLRDRDRDVSLWVSGPTFTDALASLEKALGERPVAWRRPTKDWRTGTQNRKG
jgi:hypothetical protein